METGIEKLVEGSEVVVETPVTPEEGEIKTEVETPTEPVVEVTETKTEETDGPTLADVVYDESIKEEKTTKQKEYEEEINNFSIPEPAISNEEKKEEVSNKFDEAAVETEVKEVIDEIRKETDIEKQNKQREGLLLSLREDIITSERVVKEKDIEIKTLSKKNEELLVQLQDLKYSGKNNLDDELGYFDYLREQVKKDPANKEAQKKLALFHSKALAGIYPEFDIQETFNQIGQKRQSAIMAISSGSENPLGAPSKPKEQVNEKIRIAAKGVAKK